MGVGWLVGWASQIFTGGFIIPVGRLGGLLVHLGGLLSFHDDLHPLLLLLHPAISQKGTNTIKVKKRQEVGGG
jgi:hypothetical protein